MPASFDDPPPDRPRPPPYQPEVRDENLGTLAKIGGSTFVATCMCGCGAVFLIVPMMMLPFGINPFSGLLLLVGLVFAAIGCYAGYYGWKAAEEGSKW